VCTAPICSPAPVLRTVLLFLLLLPRPPGSTLFPYTTLFRSLAQGTGLFNLSRQLGGSFGIAIAATLLHRFGEQSLDGLRAMPKRSEEHTSELQSRRDLVCRLLLEKKKQKGTPIRPLPRAGTL